MSRRTAVVEEFDDDTDLPLPSQPLPNTGYNGPLLQEINSDDDFDFPSPRAGPASSPSSQFMPTSSDSVNAKNSVTDITPYKKWTCIYPIYIDAKRPYGTGQRRVAREKSVWWPLSKDIAEATNRLGLGTLHEVNKAHPRDWENPGRVRVLWKKDGRLVNPAIQTKKQLLEMVCIQIQRLKPENIPKPPYNTSPAKVEPVIPAPKSHTTMSASTKGKQPATTKSKSPSAPQLTKTSGRRPPIPPEPHPPLASRVSPYSPAISTGVLIETVKAGMTAQEANAAPGSTPGAPGLPGGAQKGKRKVVRVRG
ncbi:signal recognition particle, SRP19 subunit [Desarmillaria tabescens]|uniref:Signal recognition particle, SRP19 subunit n=1 Tax=Armillaria tabescens TaxID=1929756 RepID=A0AA39MXL5_ARMTA|nr:signal recognition particle, SRP19 subunit [Desarmillaria tabescens]KAK0449600.1 signal recognition particle, SRP19 subunit [Desarmillaria tabescens]